ncbi:MAG: TonB-dependent receptor [Bacteroidia bacterium]
MWKFYFSAYLLFVGVTSIKAQSTIDSINLKQVDVSSVKYSFSTNTALNIGSISAKQIRVNGAFNIADGLTNIPGISQMNTGVAISKPVIRGLYGNRLQTVLSGLRFDNQQWQNEHGLGITDIGVDRVEVIKGPASLLYGSEAVGGVVVIYEEKEADEGKIIGDVNTRFLTNTLGNATDIGFKGNRNNKNWRVRAGYESDADYTDGKDNRILNSRFGGYYFKGSIGFKKNKWICQNNYTGSLNNYGFIMSDSKTDKVLDNRFSKTMDGPHHTVFLNILSSENTFLLKKSILKLNIGAQSNIRMEDEGGGEISLNMHLNSLLYNLQWIKRTSENTEFIISNQSLIQSNVNYGKRIIVPDANLFETGISFFVNHKMGKVILESGLGGNYRHITTLRTNNFNSPDKEIQPFSKSLPALNAMVGLLINPTKKLNFKLCGSTGFRSGNMAELASNGLHEGIYQYEIGNPNLKAEQNINTELSLNYILEQFQFSAAIFNNYFNNYIYLAPTNESFFGIQVYRYFQNNADLYGGETSLSFKPNNLKGLKLSSSFATVTGVLNDTSHLPFIPANKIHSEILYSFNIKSTFKECYILFSNDYVFAQNKPAVHETKTSGYILFNVGFGSNVIFGKETITFNIICNNVFNEYYYDHLSRFKYYGFHNIGRNIVLNIHIPINFK